MNMRIVKTISRAFLVGGYGIFLISLLEGWAEDWNWGDIVFSILWFLTSCLWTWIYRDSMRFARRHDQFIELQARLMQALREGNTDLAHHYLKKEAEVIVEMGGPDPELEDRG